MQMNAIAEAVPVLILGCGYVGTRLGLRERADGHSVCGTARSEARLAALAALGIASRRLDLSAPAPAWLHEAAAGAFVYYTVPPPRTGEHDAHARTVAPVLADARPRQVVLISTSAVYGDCAGAWVDEVRAPTPGSARGRRRLDAERVFAETLVEAGSALAILRVPGIYGPGRLPYERLRRGEPVLEPGSAPYSNRIHVDDLVSACRAAARTARDGVYNVADGYPSSMTDYFFRAADALGLPRPPTVTPTEAETVLGAGMREYLAESKRLDTRRMREVLGVTPRFADLDAGLRHAVASNGEGPEPAAPGLTVCINRRLASDAPSCGARGSQRLAALLEQGLAERGLALTLRRVHCLGRCEDGPNVRITPDGECFSGVTEGDCEAILRRLGAAWRS